MFLIGFPPCQASGCPAGRCIEDRDARRPRLDEGEVGSPQDAVGQARLSDRDFELAGMVDRDVGWEGRATRQRARECLSPWSSCRSIGRDRSCSSAHERPRSVVSHSAAATRERTTPGLVLSISPDGRIGQLIDGAGSTEGQGAQPNLRVLTTSRGRPHTDADLAIVAPRRHQPHVVHRDFDPPPVA